MVNNIKRYIGKSKTRRRFHRRKTSSILPEMNTGSSNELVPQTNMSGGSADITVPDNNNNNNNSNNKLTDNTSNKPKTRKMKHTFTKKDFYSGDGMLTTVWGPSMWHFLHTMSFNYPVSPSQSEKRDYMNFILNLRNVLPCKYCRMNLTNNLKSKPIKMCHMASRDTFSRFVYELHEIVNKMLGKKSGLTYCDVRERYEHFRSRCTQDAPKIFDFSKIGKMGEKGKTPEKGCTEPLYGKKAKCVISIVPQEVEVPTFQVDDKCIKKRGEII